MIMLYAVGALTLGGVQIAFYHFRWYFLQILLPALLLAFYAYSRRRAEAQRQALAIHLTERAEIAEEQLAQLDEQVHELKRASHELQSSREHFRYVAFHDTLTGLPNKAHLADQLQLAIERSRQHDGPGFAVLFLDLDRFKNINDSLGHSTGDELLKALARRLEDCLRPNDIVARLGGDEFAILLEKVENEAHAEMVAERLQKALRQPLNLVGHEISVTGSIGITLSKSGYAQPEDLLRDADTAMYRAKLNGKARHEFFDAAMHLQALQTLRMENDLRRAIERREFSLHYQPIVCLATTRIVGFEALLRWYHPERGFIPPGDFIHLAEETGLITEIGRWVLHESCHQARTWQQRTGQPLLMSVNLSGKQLARPDIIEQITDILAESALDPATLKLEITESAVMDNIEATAYKMNQLRSLGIHLSIDDFGTGYSSLSYLHRFPFNTLKIDRSFINLIGSENENSEIVRTVVNLANNLGLSVVAEGVETEEQLRYLRSLRCEYGQGYFFSRPVDAQQAASFIMSGPAQALPWEQKTAHSAELYQQHLN